ncbi:DNA-3-methyladenine glycosylase 2 [Vallitalea okinawensis]|uniref:DNA-3-methyladenine glycosylase 2 n=1 Tax=Vallitalea okinawensis TaxID=2078660 RepID=UPI000CFC8A11|nr:DNA-3-methyladenine glycosylase [Vallitalea okinawensis]
MNWIDHQTTIEICPPKEFNFQECLVFLGRSDQEILHQIRDGYVYKLIKIKHLLILIKVGCSAQNLLIEFPITPPTMDIREEVASYIWEWFDLDQDISPFYKMAKQDRVLEQLVHSYYGLRIICIPDLFEALTWAIMGQQINLTFAYTLKKRFVECFGESITFAGDTFWLFPIYETIADLDVDTLKKLQFTTRKAEYIIGVARAMTNGGLRKEALLHQQDYHSIQKALMQIRGIGAWSADYVMMKCLHHPSSFPITDVGLHNALKLQLGLQCKPTIDEIRQLASDWQGWEAYAIFYLWRSLYE